MTDTLRLTLAIEETLSVARFGHLASTNETPSCLELRIIGNLAQWHQSKIAGLDKEITQVKSDVVPKALLEQRSHELQQFDRCRCILAPIRRVPIDILVEIFLRCRGWSDPEFHRDGQYSLPFLLRTQYSPFLISRVCSYWRQVALKTPLLWNYVRFDFHRAREHSDYMWMRRKRLDRTGTTAPLLLTLHAESSPASLEFLAPYAHRIHTLFLQGPFVALPDSSFHSLVVLQLTRVHLIQPDSISVFCCALSLRKVVLVSSSINMGMPWPQLTHLSLKYCKEIPIVTEFTSDSRQFIDMPCLKSLVLDISTTGRLRIFTTGPGHHTLTCTLVPHSI